MTDFELAEETDEQPADDADEQPDVPEEGEEEPTEQEPAEPDETVVLAWVPDDDDPEKPLPEAIEANARMIEGNAGKHSVEALESSVDELQDDVDDLKSANKTLRERIDSLEGWKGQVVGRLNSISDDIRKLLTASDLDVQGVCPECGDAPLKKQSYLGSSNQIECTNEDCGHVAAQLE